VNTDEDIPVVDAALLRRRAMDALARREHSHQELVRKLRDKGAGAEIAEAIVDQLQAENLVSDERFAESLANVRCSRGQGPIRIQRELEEKGVADSIIDVILEPRDRGWHTLAAELRIRKYGATLPTDLKERARQARFLQYRGFDYEQIKYALEVSEQE